MKILQRFILPALFGLMIYASIRLVNDSMQKTQFLDRPWKQNGIEIIAAILLGIIFSRIVRYIMNTSTLDTTKVNVRSVVLEFVLVFISILLIFNPILYGIHYLIKQPVQWNDFIIGNLLVILYTLLHYALIRGYFLMRLTIKKSTEMEQLKNEQLQTELKFLKAQYHPHFLFNALNTVYFQMDDDIAEAKKTMENFAELLRYQLYQQHDLVAIEAEIKYLQNFIQLQKTRASDKLKLSVNIDSSLNGEKIYPLLMLPMLENAFKYIGGNYYLDILMLKEGDWLVFSIDNSVPDFQPATIGGIGLENLQRRLQLLYPERHSFEAGVENFVFKAVLKINLR